MGQTGCAMLDHEGLRFFVEYSYSDDAQAGELPTIDTVYLHGMSPMQELQHVLSNSVLTALLAALLIELAVEARADEEVFA